jgi:hypothetical protein
MPISPASRRSSRSDLTRPPSGRHEAFWALVTWHPVALLVEERGWTAEQLTDWLEDLFTTLLR